MKKKKVCHGWYKINKIVSRDMKPLFESNNFRKLHGLPMRRKWKN